MRVNELIKLNFSDPISHGDMTAKILDSNNGISYLIVLDDEWK